MKNDPSPALRFYYRLGLSLLAVTLLAGYALPKLVDRLAARESMVSPSEQPWWQPPGQEGHVSQFSPWPPSDREAHLDARLLGKSVVEAEAYLGQPLMTRNLRTGIAFQTYAGSGKGETIRVQFNPAGKVQAVIVIGSKLGSRE